MQGAPVTDSDLAIIEADRAERQRYAETLCLVHLSVNTTSDKALGVFDEDEICAPVGGMGE